MLRTGEIIDIDCLSGEGKILDSNEQEISFDLQDLSAVLDVGSKVSFKIEMSPKGLIAVEVCRIFANGLVLGLLI